jgi:formylglycine-generating enzyme required for sulfatase activity
LITWIDLNAPAHGTWNEVVGHDPALAPLVERGAARRRELHRRYAGIDDDFEAVFPAAVLADVPPADAGEAAHRPALPTESSRGVKPALSGPGDRETRRISLADGVEIELAHVPAGEFTMGSDMGYPNERPARRVSVARGFWIGRTEVSNRHYACFDPTHDSGLEIGEQYQFGDDERGHPLNRPEQPVVRVSWEQASAFCSWLSDRSGLRIRLPTETEWEYACRSGTRSLLWHGGLDDDFSAVANLSDATHHTVHYPHVPNALPPWRPADTRFDDRWRVSAPVGTFAPNPWGLHDMHGNVAEWTASEYEAPPGREPRRVVRGGSWLSRPRRATSSFRLHYAASQAVHDVGFRVVCEQR